MDVQDAARLFIGQHTNPETERKYTSQLDRLMDYIGRSKPITAVIPAEIVGFVNSIRAQNPSPYTLYGYVKTLKSFFNFCLTHEILQVNPARMIKNPKPKRPTKVKVATDEEQEMLLKATFHDLRNHVIATIIIETGCRAKAIADLTLDRLFLDLGHNKCYLWFIDKGESEYKGNIEDDTALLLQRWLLVRHRLAPNHNYVFCAKRKPYAKLTPPAVAQILRRAGLKVGLRSMGSHPHRHKVGFDMVRDGISPAITAEILGNSVPVVIEHYYHGNSEMAENAIRQRNGKAKSKLGLRASKISYLTRKSG